MCNLLITGAAQPNKELLSKLESIGWSVTIHQQEKEQVLNPEIYEGVICNGLFLYNDIRKFHNLKTIQLTSAGLDRVSIDYINQRGIRLFNARGVYSIPMAEWAVGVILNHYKKLNTFHVQQEKHEWIKNRSLQELSGKRVAVIGAGNIGSEVAKRLQAFDAYVTGYDVKTFDNPYFTAIKNIEEFQPQEFDIVILTAPHTEQTHHLINKDVLDHFKSESLLINMSRGGLINEESLLEVLSERADITAVLDVFEKEPLSMDSKLWYLSNIHIFPHNSFVGENNVKRLHSVILENLSEYDN